MFSPISSASDGTITKITAFDRLCGACHDGGMKPTSLNDPASINAKKQSFISSLKALSAVLAAKKIYFNPVRAPYFFSVSDPAEQTEATAYTTWKSYYVPGTLPLYSGSDLMGAAFNLRLLWSEQGAYTHNSSYIKRLIYDSIDLVDNGKFDYSTGSTIQNLPVSSDFGSEDRDRAGTYVGVRP